MNTEPLPELRELLGEIASSIHTARAVLDAGGLDDTNVAQLVVNDLGRIGWLAERAREVAGDEGPLLIGSAEGWLLPDAMQEKLRRLRAG